MRGATVYAKIGWRVVPLHDVSAGACSCGRPECPSAGKHPRTAAWQHEASADAATITEWQARWPSGNVGVATGDQFWVLDVDGAKGAETLAELTDKHGPLPETVEARTGSGGTHYLFESPDFTVKNSASRLGARKTPGLDVRGENGQIVVAPSVSGRGPYSWVRPPWNTPLAPAPEWLLELLRTAAPRPAASVPAEAPTFPPASPEVLQAAREALELHGPAVEGEGGDQHTFVAAALLVHDWALSEAEAWPLLVEWNATCAPPWNEADLAAKMRGGAKYATRPFGCRRSLDVVAAIEAQINAWASTGRGQATMFALLERVRPMFATIDDLAKHAVCEASLVAATGVPARKLGLPPPTLPSEAAPEGAITVTPELHKVADEATRAIAAAVFSRNGVLCEVAKNERTVIADLETSRILDLMSAGAKWVRHDDKAGIVTIPPPLPIAQILHARRQHTAARIRVLEAVTTAPVFLADGTILQTRGYNASARVFLEPSVAVDVPDEPTRDDAREAIRVFLRLLSDFKFSERADFASWLAGLLSPLVKAATSNAPAPLIVVSAASRGAGKSLLAKVASLIITGETIENRPYNPRDPGEWGKRLTAFVKEGKPISVFDNVNGPFGDEGLDRLITSRTWSDRILGASEAPPLPNVTTWWTTGNNAEPEGDTVRRCLMVRIEVDTEKPQERTGFKIESLETYALDHRSELLSAALTILRAYHVAGRPKVELPGWGSFEEWSALVRAALVWCGLTDPFLTQRRASANLNEPENENHDFWLSVISSTDGTPASIATLANQRDAQTVLGLRETITAYTLRKLLGRFVDKPRREQRIRLEGRFYKVVSIPA